MDTIKHNIVNYNNKSFFKDLFSNTARSFSTKLTQFFKISE